MFTLPSEISVILMPSPSTTWCGGRSGAVVGEGLGVSGSGAGCAAGAGAGAGSGAGAAAGAGASDFGSGEPLQARANIVARIARSFRARMTLDDAAADCPGKPF